MTREYQEPQEVAPSRSAKKRAAQSVEETAQQLVDLPEAAFARLPLAADLREESRKARAIRAHGARKRQVKHLAALLRRDEDALAAIASHLGGYQNERGQERERFHRLEELRQRLCDPARCEEALAEVARDFPAVDRDALAGLARSCQTGEDKRAFREIFRRLDRAGDR